MLIAPKSAGAELVCEPISQRGPPHSLRTTAINNHWNGEYIFLSVTNSLIGLLLLSEFVTFQLWQFHCPITLGKSEIGKVWNYFIPFICAGVQAARLEEVFDRHTLNWLGWRRTLADMLIRPKKAEVWESPWRPFQRMHIVSNLHRTEWGVLLNMSMVAPPTPLLHILRLCGRVLEELDGVINWL